jgi:hypothetical protein
MGLWHQFGKRDAWGNLIEPPQKTLGAKALEAGKAVMSGGAAGGGMADAAPLKSVTRNAERNVTPPVTESRKRNARNAAPAKKQRAAGKIVAGLNDAIAFAKGDKSAAKVVRGGDAKQSEAKSNAERQRDYRARKAKEKSGAGPAG